MRSNAVLFEQEGLCYLCRDSRTVPSLSLESISDCITICEENSIDVLWIMPGSLPHITWEWVGNYDRGKYSVFPDQPMQGARKKSPSYIRVRRQRGVGGSFQKEYYLAIPENEDWLDSTKTWSCPNPQTLLTTVTYIEEEYPDFAWSPQNIGKNLLKGIFERRNWQIAETIDDGRLRKAANHSVQRPTWVIDVKLFTKLKRKKWAIGGDKNAEYVGGTRSVRLGNGQYSRVGKDAFDGKTPGLWYVQITDIRQTIFDSYQSFCPWTAPQQWLSTDLLVAARAVGIQCEILEGLTWTEHGQFMNEWGKQVWQHRAAYYDEQRFPDAAARRNAAGTVKQVGNSLIGLLAHAQKMPGQGIYRPDWNTLIIHRSIANLLYSINSRHEKHGLLPVLLARGDTQWFLCDEPDVPGLFDHVREQRGWKPIGHPVRMNREIVRLFEEQEGPGVQTNQSKAAKIAEYLEREARK